MTIKFLSNTTINRIAAGEVIERPASVIKELVENAIDAGSTKIDVTLEKAGKNLIVISDNGSGMPPKDLEIAIQRHTTSKLDEDDLLNINSFGFRGEALPSIGAISKMSITSREKGADKAYLIQVTGGIVTPYIQTLHNEGTKVEIRDLFYATPARLKFLRTDKTESAACFDVVKKIAIAHPNISFSLSHDGKNIIKVRGTSEDSEDALKVRVTELIGQDFVENAAFVNNHSSGLSIMGYVALPTFNRASAEDQFLFINNRPVKDKLLNMALRVAYQDYLARDRHPVAVLFLQINPQLVDVNVHPAKSEVRFHDPNLVRGLMISAIKQALSSTSHKTSSTIGNHAIGFFNGYTKPYTSPFKTRSLSMSSSSNLLSDPIDKTQNYKPVHYDNLNDSASQVFISTPPNSNIEEEMSIDSYTFPLGAAKTQLHNTYIISETTDSIIIVDQHAAHERLGYEKIKKDIAKNGLVKQRLLIPEIIELPDENRANILFENKLNLSKFGLTLEKFGDKSILVTEIPSILGEINVNNMVSDLADHLSETGEHINLTQLIEHVTETYACHYSIRSGRKLSTLEMNEMLRQMEQTPFSGQCNHGRPTYVELKLKDIEKLFGRR